jgi:diguanylate cyclase (GGDEF)-like protein
MPDWVMVAGTAVLALSLVPILRLTRGLPAGRIRRRWYILAGLVVIFTLGYLSVGVISWNHFTTPADLIIPLIFLLWAGFVWFSSVVFLRTTNDMQKLVQLEKETITDSLMGIYNRRFLDQRLDEEVHRSQRHSLPLSILLIDIDHFKDVNDRFGHIFGDRVLSDLAQLLQVTIRSNDLIARYGGDELMIICPITDKAEAMVLAERIRSTVSVNRFPLGPETTRPLGLIITVTIGVGAMTPRAADAHAIINAADQALYRAKLAGRDRVGTSESNEIFPHAENAG